MNQHHPAGALSGRTRDGTKHGQQNNSSVPVPDSAIETAVRHCAGEPDDLDRQMEQGLKAIAEQVNPTGPPDSEKGEKVLGNGMEYLTNRGEAKPFDRPHYVASEALRQSPCKHSRSKLIEHLPDWLRPRIHQIGEPSADPGCNPYYERQNSGAVWALIQVALKDCDLSHEDRTYLHAHAAWEQTLSRAYEPAIAHMKKKGLY